MIGGYQICRKGWIQMNKTAIHEKHDVLLFPESPVES